MKTMIARTKALFYKVSAWGLLAVLAALIAYSIWYTGPGPYGQYAALAPQGPMQEVGFYPGAQAVETLAALNAEARQAKYIALAFDLPYMLLNMLFFGGLMALGLKLMNRQGTRWEGLLLLPMLFFDADLLEDICLALTLANGSELTGTLAGIFTALKFLFFMASALIALCLFIAGLVMWIRRKSAKR